MYDRVDIPGVECLQDRVGVADVRLDERKGVGREVVNTLLLDGAGIEGIEVVYCRDAVTTAEETAAKVSADKAGPAGDADVHGFCASLYESRREKVEAKVMRPPGVVRRIRGEDATRRSSGAHPRWTLAAQILPRGSCWRQSSSSD